MSLRDDLRVVAMFDSSPTVLDLFRSGKERVHEQWSDFLADSEIDAIWIATPPATHAELAEEVLRSGRSVIVEPPLALSVADGTRLVEAAECFGKSLIVAHSRRWDEDFQQALAVVRSGALGTLLSLRLTCWSYSPPQLRRRRAGETSWRDSAESGGGALWEFGSHYLDQMLELLGGIPESAYARGTASQKLDDGFMAVLDRADATVMLDVNRTALAPLDSGWEIVGSTGTYARGVLFTATPEGEVEDVPAPQAVVPADQFYTLVVGHLCGGQPNPIPVGRGMDVVRLVDAVRRSAVGGDVVLV